ncbi:superoxide dismutase family protein [Streptomyces paludis]|uniref:Superoxide dismutase family protein n=1 Tax=Streptomyces paludis TaxID=2282738 RepID=A0A345HX31_9ACTN|nr:superoxide dismutase family protein [Streptomyces paludis]AXG81255.1 superoxide dismutase family protein [Streptomyces paludis]
MRTCSKAAAATTAVAAVTAALLALPSAGASAHGGAGWGGGGVRAEGRFVTPSGTPLGDALTYETALVPVGARISVAEHVTAGARGPVTAVVLRVSGLLPDRVYGAHVHAEPCGATPDAAGPHYQNVPDPRQPSTDPAYANAENEVWLDLTTDARGTGRAVSRHDWRFRPGAANAVVLHEHGTATDPGDAGTAGGRAACLTVPFDGGTGR